MSRYDTLPPLMPHSNYLMLSPELQYYYSPEYYHKKITRAEGNSLKAQALSELRRNERYEAQMSEQLVRLILSNPSKILSEKEFSRLPASFKEQFTWIRNEIHNMVKPDQPNITYRRRTSANNAIQNAEESAARKDQLLNGILRRGKEVNGGIFAVAIPQYAIQTEKNKYVQLTPSDYEEYMRIKTGTGTVTGRTVTPAAAAGGRSTAYTGRTVTPAPAAGKSTAYTTAQLPPGWSVYTSNSGPFYHNPTTGVSQWDKPTQGGKSRRRRNKTNKKNKK